MLHMSKVCVCSNTVTLKIANETRLVFGEELSIDLMFLDWNAVLPVVDTAKSFSASTFLNSNRDTSGHSVKETWLSFAQTCYIIYTGYPNRPGTDQELV